MQNFVAVSHIYVCVHVGNPTNFGDTWARHPWDGGVADSLKYTRPHLRYFAKFGHSASNDTSVITEIRQKHMTPRDPP